MQEERIESYKKSGIERRTFQRIINLIQEACHSNNVNIQDTQMFIENLNEIEDLIYGN